MRYIKTGLTTLLLVTGALADTTLSCRVYFGTMTQAPTCGIYMAELNLEAGTLSDAVRVSDDVRPGFLKIDPTRRRLYATGIDHEAEGSATGIIRAYALLEDGTLEDLGAHSSGGTNPCHLSFGPAGLHLLAANYRSGSCAVLPIRSDGSLDRSSCIRANGENSEAQARARAHAIHPSPDGRFVLATDLGLDRILVYRFDPDAGSLEPHDPPFIETETGSGPRHLVFHPSGRYLYASLETSSQAAGFSYDATNGLLQRIQVISSLPPDTAVANTTAEVAISPEGRFLYISNRGHDSIAVFRIDTASGRLDPAGHVSVQGETPRHFAIDPSGSFLVVANQKSSSVVVFRIDRKTGIPSATGSRIRIPHPTCVAFLSP